MSGSPLRSCQTCGLIQLVHPRFCVHRLPVLLGFQSSGQDVRFASPARLLAITIGRKSRGLKPKCAAYEDESQKTDDEDDDDLCPVDCVREFKTDEELFNVLKKAKETSSLVVVDFYRTSCGSCKYIEQGFSKLCKVAGDEQAGVIFLKHNVMDEYDEQSETAERLRIKAMPLFHFYKNCILLESFPTRDKERIVEAIRKYTSSSQRASRGMFMQLPRIRLLHVKAVSDSSFPQKPDSLYDGFTFVALKSLEFYVNNTKITL